MKIYDLIHKIVDNKHRENWNQFQLNFILNSL